MGYCEGKVALDGHTPSNGTPIAGDGDFRFELSKASGVEWVSKDDQMFYGQQEFEFSYTSVSSGTCSASYFSISTPMTSINEAKG